MGTYDIRFNKSLFRKHVVSGWWEFVIGSLVSGALLAGATVLYYNAGWPRWIFMAALIVFLYIFVAGLYGSVGDTREFRRRHGQLRSSPAARKRR